MSEKAEKVEKLEVKPKKQRKTRSTRPVGAVLRPDLKDGEEKEEEDCYLPTNKLLKELEDNKEIAAALLPKQDEDDVENLQPFAANKSTESVDDLIPEEAPELADDIEEIDDEDDIHVLNSSQGTSKRGRSPTPPPDTPEYAAHQKKRGGRRQPKKVISALAEVEAYHFNQRLQQAAAHMRAREPDVVLLDDSITSPSPEKKLTIRISSRSGVQRFNLSKNESFASIFREMALHEGVSEDRIVMFLNDKTVNPYDNPRDINLHIADIIDCHVQSANSKKELDPDDPDVLEINLQGKNPATKISLLVHKRETLQRAFKEYAKTNKLDFSSLRFEFDGEDAENDATPGALDMEDGDIIDVIG